MFGVDVTVRNPRMGNCAQCGREVMANVQMLSDAPIVCSKCRCSVCRIVLSNEVCRCGVAHGKPSALNQVCERCYQLLEASAFSQPSLGIVGDAVASFEQSLIEEDEAENDFEEADEAYFGDEGDVISEDEEFLIGSTVPEESVLTS